MSLAPQQWLAKRREQATPLGSDPGSLVLKRQEGEELKDEDDVAQSTNCHAQRLHGCAPGLHSVPFVAASPAHRPE